MGRYRTAKGKQLDMEALRISNERTVALGNMKVNAKGDKLGPGGKVVETVAEKTRAYNSHNPKAVRRVSLKDPIPDTTLEEMEEPAVKKAPRKTAAKPKMKEKHLEDGSIEMIPDTGE